MIITLSGEPKSTQTIYRSACNGRIPTRYMTAEGKAIKAAYQLEARSQYRGPLLTKQLEVKAFFYFGSKRRTDFDNFNKLWADALSGIVYEDDSQIREFVWRRFYDKNKPRIELAIYEL